MDSLDLDKIQNEQEKYGHKIETLIPCLRPDMTTAEYKNEDLMRQRYYEDPETRELLQQGLGTIDPDLLSTKFTQFYSFFPSQQVMQ